MTIVGVSPDTAEIQTGLPEALVREIHPDVEIIQGDMSRYRHYSRLIEDNLRLLTNRVYSVQPGRFHLDLNGCPVLRKTDDLSDVISSMVDNRPFKAGQAVRIHIADIAAKISELNRVNIVPAGGEADFFAPLPLRYLPLLRSYEKTLNEMGIRVIGDLQKMPLAVLKPIFKGEAKRILNQARGFFIESNERITKLHRLIRFGSNGVTPEHLIHNAVSSLACDLWEYNLCAGGIFMGLTYADNVTSLQRMKFNPTFDEAELQKTVDFLLERAWQRRVRLDLMMIELAVQPDNGQTSFLRDVRRDRIAQSMKELRMIYGLEAVKFAAAMAG